MQKRLKNLLRLYRITYLELANELKVNATTLQSWFYRYGMIEDKADLIMSGIHKVLDNRVKQSVSDLENFNSVADFKQTA